MSKTVSKYVSYEEVIHSNTAKSKGLDNNPTDEQLNLIRECAINVFDPLRKHTNAPIKINSVFRGPELNKAIGGSSSSQHCVGLDTSKNSYGAAFDIDDYYWVKDRSEFNNTEMADWIRTNLDYDQLIYEFPINGYPKWVHVSYRPDGKNRKQNLIATKRNGKTTYLVYEGNEHLIKNPDLV
tara:strand:- start:735 stop:1280 length:546 start_codon:yes stop_codon:yes gene_type:complete